SGDYPLDRGIAANPVRGDGGSTRLRRRSTPMALLRRRIEEYFLRNAADIVGGLGEEKSGRLAGALEELEERNASVVAAETRAQDLERRIAPLGPAYEGERAQLEQLLEELEERDAELTRLRSDLTAADERMAAAQAEADQRERYVQHQLRRNELQERWIDELRGRTEAAEEARARAEDALRAVDDSERQR